MKKLLFFIVSLLSGTVLFGQGVGEILTVQEFGDYGANIWKIKVIGEAEIVEGGDNNSSIPVEILPADWYNGDVIIPWDIMVEDFNDRMPTLYKVAKIGDGAFANNDKITSVTRIDTTVVLGSKVFANSQNLLWLNLGITQDDAGSVYGLSEKSASDAFADIKNKCYLFVPKNTNPDIVKRKYSSFFSNSNIEIINEITITEIPQQTITLGNLTTTINLDEYIEPKIHITDYWDSEVQNDEAKAFTYKLIDNVLTIIPLAVGEGEIYIGSGILQNLGVYDGDYAFSISISVPAPTANPCDLTIAEATINPETCTDKRDGSIVLEVEGGTEPITYRWSNGRSTNGIYGVGGGWYEVLVTDANGCSQYAGYEVPSYYVSTWTSQSIQPTCGLNNGEIEGSVSVASTEQNPCELLWSTGATTETITDLPAGTYWIEATDKNGCKSEKYFVSLSNVPKIENQVISAFQNEPSSCSKATGEALLYFAINGEPQTLNLEQYSFYLDGKAITSDIKNEYGFNTVSNLAVGMHLFEVIDPNGCKMIENFEISQSGQILMIPEISSVLVGEESNDVLVAWNKLLNDDIDFYTIYRETETPGAYEKVDQVPYSQLPIFADQNVDADQASYRYKLSATDFCGNETAKSMNENKSINLKKEEKDGKIILSWDAYEGQDFAQYVIYQIKQKGIEEIAVLPFNVSSYTIDAIPDAAEGIRGYKIGVRFAKTLYIEDYTSSKAESGPFSLAMSNLAELENFEGWDDAPSTSANVLEYNGVKVYSQGKTIVVSGASELIEVYNIIGQKIATAKPTSNEVRISIPANGVYSVVVGKQAFKTVIK